MIRPTKSAERLEIDLLADRLKQLCQQQDVSVVIVMVDNHGSSGMRSVEKRPHGREMARQLEQLAERLHPETAPRRKRFIPCRTLEYWEKGV
jgi:hypothetical protein